MIRAAVLSVAMSVVLGVALHAQPSAADEPLAGIWSNEMRFAPGLHGSLTVVQKGSVWTATLSGAESTSELTGERIRFAFPGNGGEFRGTLSTDGRAITGFWLQPAGETQDPRDPGGSGQPFASPLVLRRVRAGIWRGTVRPLEDRFTLYLRIFHDAEGSLIGAFRNPDQNSNGGSMQFRVTREGDSVIFTARRDPSLPEIRLTATLATSPDRLQIRWPDLNRVIDLKRRTPAETVCFFPRPPGQPKYVYRKPPATGDGWETARARDVGMDEAALAKLIQRLIDADPSVRRPALIHSILVAHKGKLVLEEYFYGFDRDRPHDFAYLDGGAWHGRRLVAPAWVKLSTAPHMEVTPATTGLDPKQFSNVYIEAVDGFAWHLSELKSGDHTYRDYAATGNGGQLLIVVPELDLTVVFTAGNYGQGGIWGRFRDQIVPREIIPAIRRLP